MKPTIDRKESGQALILVLILLLLGALIITPLLAFMSTGLLAGKANEESMLRLYAADAGVEDAIWKIMNDRVPPEPYYLMVNNRDVEVTIPAGNDEEIAFFINLGVLKDTNGNYHKARPAQEWFILYAPLVDEEDICYEYRIIGFYFPLTGKGGIANVLSTGFWLRGYNYYKPGTVAVQPWDEDKDSILQIDLNDDGELTWVDLDVPPDGIPDVDENNITTYPLVDDPEYPINNFNQVDFLGRAFIWEWNPAKGPDFGQGVICRTQRFRLDPAIPLSDFPIDVAWLETTRNNIQISWAGAVTGISQITAVATGPTNKKTTIKSYVFTEEVGDEVDATIFTWGVS